MKLLIILLVFLPIIINAESYTIYDFIDYAMEESPRVRKELLSYENALSTYRSSIYDFLPTASVNSSISNNSNSGTFNNASFSLSKNISLNEPTYFNLRRSGIEKQNAQIVLDEAKKNIAYEITARFIAVLQAMSNLDSYRESLEIQRKINQQTEFLYQVDKVSLLELRQSEINMLDMEISYKNAQDELTKRRRDLFNYLDLEDENFDFEEVDVEIYEDLQIFGTEHYLDLQRLKNDLRRTQLTLRQNSLDFLPSLRLSYNYNIANTYKGNYISGGLTDFGDYTDGYTISLTLSYSLFNLLQHGESSSRLRRNYKTQLINYQEYKNEKILRIENALMDFHTLQEFADLYNRRFELARDNKDLAEQRYQLGLINLIEYEQANYNYLRAQIDMKNQYYRLLLKQEELNVMMSRQVLGRW